jgi:hypothetical protein
VPGNRGFPEIHLPRNRRDGEKQEAESEGSHLRTFGAVEVFVLVLVAHLQFAFTFGSLDLAQSQLGVFVFEPWTELSETSGLPTTSPPPFEAAQPTWAMQRSKTPRERTLGLI